MDARFRSKQTINCSVDPRIELLSIVLKLSGYGERYPGRMLGERSDYGDAVETHFAPFAKHPVVKRFREWNATISGDLPVTLALHFSNPPGLAIVAEPDALTCARAGSGDLPAAYAASLRTFAADTGFPEFFESRRDEHSRITAGPVATLAESQAVALLEDYFGWELAACRVIFAPLLHSVAFGPRVRLPGGGLAAYGVFPSAGVEAGRIRFKEGRALESRILHEFAHSFVNPLVDEHRADFADFIEGVGGTVYNTKARYGENGILNVYEHLVRAVTTRLTEKTLGEAAARAEQQAHESQGFAHIAALCGVLTEYESNRNRYPSFRDFFPVVLKAFDKLASESVRSLA
jgi:hypothetical protein